MQGFSSRRVSLIALTCVVFGSLAGGWLGGRVEADERRPEDGLDSFGRVLALIEDQYVGTLDNDAVLKDALGGMLRTLDPHSNYLDADEFGEMRDQQRGKFSGLGIHITKRGTDKPLTIIAPIDGTPAWRAGLQSGDIISKIEGKPTIEMTVQEAVKQLKGLKGSRVTITITRPGLEDAFDVSLERDDIPIDSIRVSYMVAPGVGVIRIADFTTTTSDELDTAIARLEDAGMNRLILDLRGNPGGLLEQAVQVSEHFLAKGKRVVFTRGRIPGANQDFVSRADDPILELPLIVLVDRSSASASEIVSGAIQDHDRGLLVGEATFGKGLVQRVIPVDRGALVVTTAKYYTPSGRLIQRDYSDIDEYQLSARHEAEAITDELPELAPPAKPVADREIFHTASGRPVYGGGGITPDHLVPTPKAAPLMFRLVRENAIFDYAVDYSVKHPVLEPGFEFGPEQLKAFRQFVAQRGIEITDAEFAPIAEETAVRIRAQIARIRWDQATEARILSEIDPQLRRALELFGEAEALARVAATAGDPGRVSPEEAHGVAGSVRSGS